jgi:hypothetical protein
MLADNDTFWFVSSELLTEVLHAELSVLTHLLAKHPDLPSLLDAAAAAAPQRTACFALVAHRKLVARAEQTEIESPGRSVWKEPVPARAH